MSKVRCPIFLSPVEHSAAWWESCGTQEGRDNSVCAFERCQEKTWIFPGGSEVKNLSAVQEMRVWSLGQEDPLEEEMATHSNILAWEIPWTEKTGGLQPIGSQRVRLDWAIEHRKKNTKPQNNQHLYIIYKQFLHGSSRLLLTWTVWGGEMLLLSFYTWKECWNCPQSAETDGRDRRQSQNLNWYLFHSISHVCTVSPHHSM